MSLPEDPSYSLTADIRRIFIHGYFRAGEGHGICPLRRELRSVVGKGVFIDGTSRVLMGGLHWRK